MSKKKILLIVVAVVFGAAAMFFGSLMYMFHAETKKMAPLATGEVAPGIYAVLDDFVNMYLVKTKTGYIAFDAGNDADNAGAELKSLGIDPLAVRALFLTHSDGDHVAAAGLFTNAVIYLAGEEEPMINGMTERAPFMRNRFDLEHRNLKDEHRIEADGALVEAYLTPGHTPGSMSFLVNRENLFTGDTLSLRDGKVGLFNEFFNMDSEEQKRSITRIGGFKGVKRIFTAHYGYTADVPAAFRDWK